VVSEFLGKLKKTCFCWATAKTEVVS